MPKYKATPGYDVEDAAKGVRVKFDSVGEYETSEKAEIEVLDGLAPRYVTKLEDAKKPAKGDK